MKNIIKTKNEKHICQVLRNVLCLKKTWFNYLIKHKMIHSSISFEKQKRKDTTFFVLRKYYAKQFLF